MIAGMTLVPVRLGGISGGVALMSRFFAGGLLPGCGGVWRTVSGIIFECFEVF
jgi:hypothetical protein